MDIKRMGDKGAALLKKYKFVVLILVIGIILMLLPTASQKEETKAQPSQAQPMFADPTEELQNLLSQIHGAGKVRLMLTVAGGEKYIYQTDRDETANDESSTVRIETVILTDSDRTQNGMVQQIIAPQYRGAVVVCQGADDPNVKLAIMDAVKNMTGLGYDRISVLKMK